MSYRASDISVLRKAKETGRVKTDVKKDTALEEEFKIKSKKCLSICTPPPRDRALMKSILLFVMMPKLSATKQKLAGPRSWRALWDLYSTTQRISGLSLPQNGISP